VCYRNVEKVICVQSRLRNKKEMDALTFRPSHIVKLFTKDDYGNVHKTLGLLVLIHYVYRIHQWLTKGVLTFTTDRSLYTAVLLHGLLSYSSLIFHLPAARNPKAPMIYPEFRLHSIIFATRSLACMLLAHSPAKRAAVCMFTMASADYTTHVYKNNASTMRGMPFPDYITPSIITLLNYFYSVCQVFATLEVLMRDAPGNAFMVMFPIQLAAFLMTCVRKGIITAGGWHLCYTLSLLTTMLYSLTSQTTFDAAQLRVYLASSAFFCVTRFVLRRNKYWMWTQIMTVYLIHDVNRA